MANNKKEKKDIKKGKKTIIGLLLLGILFLIFTYGTEENPTDRLFSGLTDVDKKEDLKVTDDLESEIAYLMENDKFGWDEQVEDMYEEAVGAGNYSKALEICSILRDKDDRGRIADNCYWKVGEESGNYSACMMMEDERLRNGCLIQAVSGNFYDNFHVMEDITVPPKDLFYLDNGAFICDEFKGDDEALRDVCMSMHELYIEEFEEDN